MNPAIEIGIRILLTRHPDPAVMGNEVYLMTDCHLIPDRYQIWFAAEGEQVCAVDLYTLSYLSPLAPEVSDRIPVKPHVVYGQHKGPADHR
jgi:hypothetical protein